MKFITSSYKATTPKVSLFYNTTLNMPRAEML